MDPLEQFLNGPRAANAFTLGAFMSAPWAIEVRDGAALTLIAVTNGQAFIDGQLLTAGDVVLVRGPEPYVVGDSAGREPSIIIHPGQRCTTPGGEELSGEMSRGLRNWGNSGAGTVAAGDTTMLIGSYEREGEIGRIALRALPHLAIMRSGNVDAAILALLERELFTDAIAQSVLLDRLLDLLLISCVRAWERENSTALTPSWLVADDAIVAGALRRIHETPQEPWTVERLARSLSVSRAALAARFRARVGLPPIAYLTEWRLSLASEYLADPNASVAAVGKRVGYESPFTFSVAFKRHFGRSPHLYRRHLALRADGRMTEGPGQ